MRGECELTAAPTGSLHFQCATGKDSGLGRILKARAGVKANQSRRGNEQMHARRRATSSYTKKKLPSQSY